MQRLIQPSNPQPLASTLKAQWDGITVEYGYMDATGGFDVAMPKQAISVAFAPHDRVTWSVDGGSSQVTALPPGSVFLVTSRNFVWHFRERASEYIHITLDPDFLNQVASESGLSTPVEINYRIIFPDPTILDVARLLKSEVLNGGLAGTLWVESLRNLLAIFLLRNHSMAIAKPMLEDGQINALQLNQVKDFIEERLAEDLTIADLAAVVHMSQFHFARAFKATAGQSPYRYLTQQRIERAKVLLSVTRLPVAEVAHRVGFHNTSHFFTQFRKATGTTPKAYRDNS